MAKTDIFSSSSSLSTIEAITGIQAPVMADFVQYDDITVRNDHGERRFQQRLINNLKGSSGIERIPFNGIDELDTEQGPNGETVYALSSGDSRIRFIDGVEQWQFFVSSNAGGTQPGAVVQVASTGAASTNNTELMGSVEITFFGTALNILSFSSTQPTNWLASVNGEASTQVSPNNNTVNLTSPAQIDNINNVNNNTKVNQVVPIVSGLTAGVHTVRIDGHRHGSSDSGTGGTEFALFGCEVINENAAIQQQPGADFDGRVSTLNGVEFPIAPDNTIVPSFNSTTALVEGLANTTNGARVLNYLTSGGQYKQSFTTITAPINEVESGADYTVLFSASGAGSVTIPASAQSFKVIAFGGGATGGNGVDAESGVMESGAGGGGGARTEVTYTRNMGNTATLSVTDSVGISVPFGGTASVGNTTVTAGGSLIVTSGGGAAGMSGTNPDGGDGGTAVAETATVTGWTIDTNSTELFNGGDGSDGGNAPGAGGNVGGGVATPPLSGNEGAGGGSQTVSQNGNPGILPGGGGHGGFFGLPPFVPSGSGGAGTIGRLYIEFTATTGLTITTTGTATSVSGGGADLGAPEQRFGNTDHRNQEVIRRINFREFGANNQWAILSGTSPTTLNAFTLDDGTTTLSGNCQQTTQDGLDILSFANNANFVTLTFVGTGLDIFRSDSANGGDDNYAVLVDGLSIGRLNAVTVGSTTTHPGSRIPRITPIVSGLAYGTHTVQFDRVTASTYDLNIADFIIYGPKKPEIPTLDAGSLELSDYNIMADFIADTANNINSVSKGSLGKAVARECILNNGASGTDRWTTELSTDGNSYGSRLNETGDGTVSGQELFYTFYGDAFSMRMKSSDINNDSSHRFFLDGTQITRTNAEGWDVDEIIFLNNTETASSDPSQAWPATGDIARFNGTDTTKIIFPPSFNMGLGVHTISIKHALNVAGVFNGMEIGTPIHINDDNLKVGSEGLNNLTIDPVVEEDEQQTLANLGEAKAWINFDITTSSTINSSHNISAVIRASDSTARYYFDKPFKDSNYVVISTIFDTNNSPAATVLEQRANYVAINASLSGNEKQYIVCFGELIDE